MMKKNILCLCLFFCISSYATAQESPYSLLVIEKTSLAPSTSNTNITYNYNVIHYTGKDAVTLVTASSNINDIVQTLSDIKKQGWSIVSTTKDFFMSPIKVSPAQMS